MKKLSKCYRCNQYPLDQLFFWDKNLGKVCLRCHRILSWASYLFERTEKNEKPN